MRLLSLRGRRRLPLMGPTGLLSLSAAFGSAVKCLVSLLIDSSHRADGGYERWIVHDSQG